MHLLVFYLPVSPVKHQTGLILLAAIIFKNVYNYSPPSPVFAGVAPLKIDYLQKIPVTSLCLYFLSWSFLVLGYPKFVTNVTPLSCVGCTSVFIPGTVESARLRDGSGNLNRALLNGTSFSHAPAIVINNAPSYHLEFSQLNQSVVLNMTQHCKTYGIERGEGIHICLMSQNFTLSAGTLLLLVQIS